MKDSFIEERKSLHSTFSNKVELYSATKDSSESEFVTKVVKEFESPISTIATYKDYLVVGNVSESIALFNK